MICQYQPKRGKRSCSRLVSGKDGVMFCDIHTPLQGEREECEYCHQMIKKNCKRHVNKCSSLALRTMKLPYYSYNYNRMREEDENYSIDTHPVDENELAARVQELYWAYVQDYMHESLLDDSCLEELNEPESPKLGATARKHLIQQQRIVRSMEEHGILDGEPSCFVEFGAGKGSLSKAIGSNEHSKVSQSFFVCIEKSAYKHKAENNELMQAFRARIDLSHLNLSKLLDEISNKSPTHCNSRTVVGTGKHVCGEATDLALHALKNFLYSARDLPSCDFDSISPSHVKGIALALCCHSLCCWDSYVGRSWLENEANITSAEFDCLRKWSGFFVLDNNHLKSEDKKDIGNDDLASRARLGRICKRIIDFGRIHFVRTNLKLHAHLEKFVDESVTPENVLLVAY